MARPSFKPTDVMRRQVAVAAGGGMSHEEICLGLGISRNTLEKHFGVELSTGANQRRLVVINAMFTAAKKGNVAAQKAYLAATPPLAAPPAETDTPKQAKLGKKDQADADAVTAGDGTEWGNLLTVPAGTPVQ